MWNTTVEDKGRILAKARARVSAYDELQPADLEEAIIHIRFFI